MHPLIYLPLLLLLGNTLSSAETKEKPSRHVRFLAMGEAPPFRQEIRDGVRYELDPLPGSLPPTELILESGEAVKPRLGMITQRVKTPGGSTPLVARRAGDSGTSDVWARIEMPDAGDYLVYLFRNPAGKTWNDVMSKVVPDGDGTPAGNVRITNLFPQTVTIVWGKEVVSLERGVSILRKAIPNAETPFQILAADSSGKLKSYHSSGVSQNVGERVWITIYRADGITPRRPLKVSILKEPVVKEPER